jgi:hypothetical protein
MTKLSFFTLALLAVQVVAFCPQSRTSSRQISFLRQADAGVAADPFDDYQPGSGLAFKDKTVGQGEGAADGDVLTISYTAYLWKNLEKLDQGDKYTFKMGSGNVMPGIDKGMVGAAEGGTRTLRIPPSLAYGEKGKGSKVPPNSDLQLEVEVKKITRGLAGELALFGEDRALIFAGCVALIAFAPMIEKALS